MNSLIAILAAGQARRFGEDKLAQPCRGKPLGRWSLDTALATGRPVVWIAGASVHPFVAGRCPVLRNDRAQQGLSTSLVCAAEFADRHDYAALLVLLADMPLVGTALLADLLEKGPPSACRYPDGGVGVPALFPRSSFGGLRRLTGDSGAGELLARFPDLEPIECNDPVLSDVDRPEDLAKVIACLAEHPVPVSCVSGDVQVA